MPTTTRRSPARTRSSAADLNGYRAELLRLLDEAYAGPAWHGASLRGTLRGVDAEEALWRAPGTQNRIWDLVAHVAYSRHVVRRRIDPEHTPEFPMPMERKWWPRVELDGLSADAAWRRDLALLADEQAQLLDLVRTLSARRLVERRPGKNHVWGVEISGVALHDTYHGGQIALIRRIRREHR